MQQLETWSERAAAVFAILLVTVASWWKGRGIVRRDVRQDRSEQRVDEASGQIIEQLRAEVARYAALVESMGERLDAMSARIDDETTKRRMAEAEAASLRLRVLGLEIELKELRGVA